MIRLTLFGIIIFSCLTFLTGKSKAPQGDYLSVAAFESDNNSAFDAQQASSQTQIDLSAFKKSVIGLKSSIHETISGFFTSKTTVQASGKPSSSLGSKVTKTAAISPKQSESLSSHLVQAMKAKRKQAQPAKKVVKSASKLSKKSKKIARYGLTLPVARPKFTEKKRKHAKKKKKSIVASFKNFISPKKNKNKNLQLANMKASAKKTRTSYRSHKRRSHKNLSPRFLTVLIKRELQRLNCYNSTASANWNSRVQRRLEAINLGLTSSGPTVKTLIFLENQDQLTCTTSHSQKVRTVDMQKPALKYAKAQKYPKHNIIIRDRSGKILTVKSTKQMAALKKAKTDNKTIDLKQLALEEKQGSDFSYDRNSMRPPAYAVGRDGQNPVFQTTGDQNDNGIIPAQNREEIAKIRTFKRKKEAKKWAADFFKTDF